MKFLVDMNLSPGWVGFLVESGFEAVHWSQIGAGDAPDAELMRWAAEHGYVVLTSDLGFSAILAATRRSQPSVIQLRGEWLLPPVIGAKLLAAVSRAGEELKEGAAFSGACEGPDAHPSAQAIIP